MKKNMGVLDRAIRVVLVLVIVILYVAGAVSGLAAVILGIIALAFLVTGIIGSCPGYLPFNISTMPKK